MKKKINQKAPWYRSPDFDPAHEPTYTPKSCRRCKHALTGTYSTSTKVFCDHENRRNKTDSCVDQYVKENTLPWWCPCLPVDFKREYLCQPVPDDPHFCDTCEHLTGFNGCGHPQMLDTGPQPGPRYVHPVRGPHGKRYPKPNWCPLQQLNLQGEPLTPEVFEKVAEQVKSWRYKPSPVILPQSLARAFKENQPTSKRESWWTCTVCAKDHQHAHWDPVKAEARCPDCGSRLTLKVTVK